MRFPYEYSGCIHVHSRYSDGSGSIKTIAEAAIDRGLDFVIVTDHDTLKGKKFEGYYGSCLLLVGEEISPLRNHALALNAKSHIPHHFRERAQGYIDLARAQGGIVFITHPFGESRFNLLFHKVRIHRWEDWEAEGFSGMEIWSYMIDWIRDVHIRNLASAIRDPDAFVKGPGRETLRQWDLIGRRRRCSGLGSLDVHAKNLIPFVPLIQVFPYREMFDTIRTHVLLKEEFRREKESDAALIYDALKEGRCFIANHRIGKPAGFKFYLEAGSDSFPMGSEITSISGRKADLVVGMYDEATIRLMRSGDLIELVKGKELHHCVQTPGVYRVEVFKEGKPWIFSNPIYVRE
ncbi:MAG: CehA/McbA family metallohydrolase [Candidatus Omnitrophica bacterium]|nr:CehA/McbA family metallohydrolase [Candidatus Omnitrophota bacterium]